MSSLNSVWARIVVVAYNSGDVLQTCIDCLSAQSDQDFEVVIVNNFDGDESLKTLDLPNDRYRIVHSMYNSGFSGGTNLGAKGARSDWIISLNPDAHTMPNWLAELKRAALTHPEYRMLSPILLRAEDETILDGCGDVLSNLGFAWRGGQGHKLTIAPKSLCRVFAPCGACAAYKREVFEAVSGFDETFFCYLEDVDIGLRLNVAGEKCLLVPEAKVRHIGSATLGEGHSFIIYHSQRNMITMIVKSFPVLNAIIGLPLHIAATLWIVLRNKGAKRNSYVLKGMGAGICRIPQSIIRRFARPNRTEIKLNLLFLRLNFSLKALRTKKIFTWPVD